MLEKLNYEVKGFEKGVGVVFNRPPRRKVLDYLKSKGFKWNWQEKVWIHSKLTAQKVNQLMQDLIVKNYGYKFYGTEAAIVGLENVESVLEEKEEEIQEEIHEVKEKIKPLCTVKQRDNILSKCFKKATNKQFKNIYLKEGKQCIFLENAVAGVVLENDIITNTEFSFKEDKDIQAFELIQKLEKKFSCVESKTLKLEIFKEFVDVSTTYSKYENIQNIMRIKNDKTEAYFDPNIVFNTLKIAFRECKEISVKLKDNIMYILGDNKNTVFVCGVLNVDFKKDIVPTYQI